MTVRSPLPLAGPHIRHCWTVAPHSSAAPTFAVRVVPACSKQTGYGLCPRPRNVWLLSRACLYTRSVLPVSIMPNASSRLLTHPVQLILCDLSTALLALSRHWMRVWLATRQIHCSSAEGSLTGGRLHCCGAGLCPTVLWCAEYLQEFLQNMLSSFSAIGQGLEKVEDTLKVMVCCRPPSRLRTSF